VNISSQELKELDNIFEGPAQVLYGSGRKVDPVTPFTTFGFDPEPPVSPTGSAIVKMASAIDGHGQYSSGIPESFSATVFNRAEQSVKYLVLTNTMPKFVQSGQMLAHLSAAE
jgi:hypothetical protein